MQISKKADGSIKIDSGENIFFISDMHFGHENIIRYCKRPYSSVEEMEEALVSNWNSVVGKDDVVFNLGDYVFGNRADWKRITERLNGKQYLIMGNHDRHGFNSGFAKLFEEVYPMGVYAIIGNKKMYLTHDPKCCYDGMYRAMDSTWNLYGHIHSGPRTQDGLDVKRMKQIEMPMQYDVGVDNNDFTPISFEQVKHKIEDQMLSLNLIK